MKSPVMNIFTGLKNVKCSDLHENCILWDNLMVLI